jgi:hypothetical protein
VSNIGQNIERGWLKTDHAAIKQFGNATVVVWESEVSWQAFTSGSVKAVFDYDIGPCSTMEQCCDQIDRDYEERHKSRLLQWDETLAYMQTAELNGRYVVRAADFGSGSQWVAELHTASTRKVIDKGDSMEHVKESCEIYAREASRGIL